MTADSLTSIAFIGFGEVGQTFAKGFGARGDIRMSAYDLKFTAEPDGPNRKAAEALGVRAAISAADAAQGADFVLSAVTASQAEAVAREAAGYLRPGQYFVDVNSAAPTTKQRAAAAVQPTGGDYIECAVMAPVLAPGIKVPCLTGGPKAEEASALLNSLGMKMTPVAAEYGRASAMKLCRSIMIKGLEALMVDCAQASAKWGVTDTVFGSLAGTFPSIDWPALAENMQERVATHGVRRSAEMYEAAEMVAALGMNPELVAAVAAAQLRGAKNKPA